MIPFCKEIDFNKETKPSNISTVQKITGNVNKNNFILIYLNSGGYVLYKIQISKIYR